MRSQGDSTVLLLDTAGGLKDHQAPSARDSMPPRLGRYELNQIDHRRLRVG